MTRLGDTPPPSWRTQVGNALYVHAGWPADQVNHFLDQMLKEHAHELAEKIRPMCSRAGAACADSIDPEVSDGQS